MSRPLLAPVAVVLCLILLASPASAQTDSSLVTKPWIADQWFGETKDKPLYESPGHVNGEDANAHVFWWDSNGRFRFDRGDATPVTIGYRWLTTNFATESPRLPDHLDDGSLALGFPAGRVAGGDLSFVLGAGFASDTPFADLNGLYGIGHAVWNRPMNDRDALVFSIDYDGNGEFLPDMPLPGVQFVHRTDRFSVGAGFPKTWLNWRLTDPLTLTASYGVPYTAAVQLEYAFNEKWSAFGGAENAFDGFRLRDEPTTDRLFFEIARAEVGVRYRDTLFGWLYTDIAVTGGYAFNQTFDRGFDSRQLDHVATLSDEPYIGVVVVGRY